MNLIIGEQTIEGLPNNTTVVPLIDGDDVILLVSNLESGIVDIYRHKKVRPSNEN